MISQTAFGDLYNIPSQALSSALQAMSKQSGAQIFSSHRLTQNLQSPSLMGDFKKEEALSVLLGDSGLTYKKLRNHVFVIIYKNEPLLQKNSNTNANYQFEEVIINSRRRAENLQKTPLSVAAFTEEKIQRSYLSELPELSRLVPNLMIVPSPPISGNSAAAAVFIRGVGQLDFTINVDPGVGIYVDGVYLVSSVGSVIDLIDLERIEVLRGPQGTLFGRNTIGGALRLMSKAPSDKPSTNLSLTMGSDHRQDLKGVLNIPISENLLSKISLLKHLRNGYVSDGNGQDLGNDNSTAIRSQLLWQVNNGIEFSLIMDYTKDRENGSPNTPLNLFSTGQVPDRVNNGAFGEARRDGCNNSLLDTSRLCFGPAWLTGNKNQTLSTFPARSDNDIYGVSLTVDYDLNQASFKSITAWRDLDSEFQRDSDHSPFNVFATANDQQHNQFSQELQIQGDSFNETVYWITGVYYLKEKGSEFTRVFLPDNTGLAINGLFDHHSDNKNWAIYGETTLNLNKALQLTLGTRYTVEHKYYASQDIFVYPDNPNNIVTQLVDEPGQSQRFKELTSKITLSYDWTAHLMSYITYSQGFKSGGFNARHLAPSPNLRAITYNPEYVTQYETGIKFYNKNKTLQINSAIFYSDYSDIQISTNPDFTSNATITQNAAEAEISGFELEFTYSPTRFWLLEGGLGYLDAAYKSLGEKVTIELSNDFVWVPQWSGALALSYITNFESGATLTPRIGMSYQSETQGTAENELDVRQSGYSLVDLAILFKNAARSLSVSFGVSNLTDKDYLVSANENQGIGYAEGVFARGMQWHFTMQRQF